MSKKIELIRSWPEEKKQKVLKEAEKLLNDCPPDGTRMTSGLAQLIHAIRGGLGNIEQAKTALWE